VANFSMICAASLSKSNGGVTGGFGAIGGNGTMSGF
jgi:hypothetical protein